MSVQWPPPHCVVKWVKYVGIWWLRHAALLDPKIYLLWHKTNILDIIAYIILKLCFGGWREAFPIAQYSQNSSIL